MDKIVNLLNDFLIHCEGLVSVGYLEKAREFFGQGHYLMSLQAASQDYVRDGKIPDGYTIELIFDLCKEFEPDCDDGDQWFLDSVYEIRDKVHSK